MHSLLRPLLRAAAVVVVFSGIAGIAVCAQGPSHLTLQDLLSVQPFGETALSPDGKTIAFTQNGQIVLMPADGGWPVTVTSTTGRKSGIAWSPDGKKLAFVDQGSIWMVSVTGGNPHRLTTAPPAATGDPRQAADRAPVWSPKGRWILFQSGRRNTNSLMVVSEDGNVISFLTSPKVEAGVGVWSPDGERIAYVERAKEYFSGKLKVLHFDAHTGQLAGETEDLYTSPVDRGGGWSIRGAEWSPDGKELATVLQNSGWDHIYLIPSTGGTPKQITDGAFDDEGPVFSPDGRSIAFTSSRGLLESKNIWVMSAQGGDAHLLTKFQVPGVSATPQWAPDSKEIFFHHQSPVETADLLVANVDGREPPKYLSHTTPKNFANAQMPERVTWKSKDGKEIVGILYTPPGAKPGVKLPAVLWIHGGPEAQDVFRADSWAQYLAQAGYLVLEPNYRGSSGYGEAFRNLNVEDSNGGEVDDVAAGAQYLVTRGLADPARLAIGGGSHGGTMVAYMVVHYPTLFAAAMELFGVVDRELFVERTNPPSSIRWMMKMGGSPSEKPDVYRRADVLLQVDKVQTPLLVMHGENDPQVPPADSALFVKALKEHHKTVFYFTYPGELHGFSQPAHRLDAWEKQLAFLEHYINPKFGTTSTNTGEVAFPGLQQTGSHPETK